VRPDKFKGKNNQVPSFVPFSIGHGAAAVTQSMANDQSPMESGQ
jgi:hypothetical protein